jgi:hypothetical protein
MRCSEAARSVVGLQRRGEASGRGEESRETAKVVYAEERALKMREGGRERNLSSKTLFPHQRPTLALAVCG